MPKFLDTPSWYSSDGKFQNGINKKNVYVATPSTYSESDSGATTSFSLTSSQVEEGGDFEGISIGDFIYFPGSTEANLSIVTSVAFLSPSYYVSIRFISRHLYTISFIVSTYSTYVFTHLVTNRILTNISFDAEALCRLLVYNSAHLGSGSSSSRVYNILPASGCSGSPYASQAVVYGIYPDSNTQGNIKALLVDEGTTSSTTQRYIDLPYSVGLIGDIFFRQLF